MQIRTCKFVHASDLFKGLPLAWKAFCNDEHGFTWGSNTCSMITKVQAEDSIYCIELDNASEGSRLITELATVSDRLRELASEVLIDLEN